MSDLLTRLIAAGTPADLIAEVAMLCARAEVDREAIETRRTKDRERQAARRNVTSRDTADVADAPPSLDKEIPPRPPKEINSIPRVSTALARKAAGFGPPENIEVQMWNEFCSQRKKPLTPIAYDAITKTLTEAAQVGWPPGEVISRSIASGWETVFVPKDQFNGSNRQSGFQRPQRVDGFTAALRQVAGSQAPDRDAHHGR